MSAAELRPWFEHPQSQALLRFNLNPSRLVHPSRVQALLPPGLLACWPDPGQALEDPRLHRHWSGALVAEHGLLPPESIDEAGLVLGALPQPLFGPLAMYCGLALLAPEIRRVITRTDVAALEAQVGPRGLAFARRGARGFWGAMRSPVALAAGEVAVPAMHLGAAVLDLAWTGASVSVAGRARLRLPAGALDVHDEARSAVVDAVEGEDRARALALAVLQELEPTWLSSFHAIH